MERREKVVKKKLSAYKGFHLDVACGDNKQRGFIGIDKRKTACVDIVHDLEKFPWPLETGSVSRVVISHFWEHIKPWLTLDFMAELHRVCLDEAQVFISGPYGHEFRFIQDPTHCNPSNEATFLYWDNKHALWNVYKPESFHLEYYEIIPVGNGRDFNAILRVCKAKVCKH